MRNKNDNISSTASIFKLIFNCPPWAQQFYGRAMLNRLLSVCLPGRHHCPFPPGWSSCSSVPDSERRRDGRRAKNNTVSSTKPWGELQSGTLFNNMCYQDCVKRRVFRRTTGQAVILRHGSSIFCSLHTHEGWRRAQSDGLLQLELQKHKTQSKKFPMPKSVSLFNKAP